MQTNIECAHNLSCCRSCGQARRDGLRTQGDREPQLIECNPIAAPGGLRIPFEFHASTFGEMFKKALAECGARKAAAKRNHEVRK